jgi:predicted branched-subunit amino acid permease
MKLWKHVTLVALDLVVIILFLVIVWSTTAKSLTTGYVWTNLGLLHKAAVIISLSLIIREISFVVKDCGECVRASRRHSATTEEIEMV